MRVLPELDFEIRWFVVVSDSLLTAFLVFVHSVDNRSLSTLHGSITPLKKFSSLLQTFNDLFGGNCGSVTNDDCVPILLFMKLVQLRVWLTFLELNLLLVEMLLNVDVASLNVGLVESLNCFLGSFVVFVSKVSKRSVVFLLKLFANNISERSKKVRKLLIREIFG